MRIRNLASSALALTACVALAPGMALADAAMAKATAAQHAGLAAGSGDLNGVRMHLHHTLNCLVGPDGEGFDQSAGNPCGEAGGVIPQTADAEMKEKLMGIAHQVHDAIMAEDAAAAKEVAAEVQEMLGSS